MPASTLSLLQDGLPQADVEVAQVENLSPDELLSRCRSNTASILCSLADPLDADLIVRLPDSLRVIATFAVGYNNIDVEACNKRGIAVTHTPGVLTDATAEIAIGLMLACRRRLIEGEALMRSGRFTGWQPCFHLGHGLYGARVALVGAGRIALRVARTLRQGFDCEIAYVTRSPRPEWERELAARPMALHDALAWAEVVSLHCPLTRETHHMIGASELALMSPGACLINTARGPVVDEAALVAALHAGKPGSAGLDVYEREPAMAQGLAELPNVVLLPHLGSATIATREKMGAMCARAIVDACAGTRPTNLVPESVWPSQ